MLVGIALRLWQYLANSSLWVDEIALSRNIIDRSFAGLLAPLDYAQVAPIGFRFAEKAVATVFGTSEYALRAVALVCGISSLFLFWMVARRVVSGWAVAYAFGLFALGIPFIYFSSQVKQYSTDVAVALVILLATLEVRRRGVNLARALWLGLIGAVSAWFSQPALFVMAGIGAGLLLIVCMERDHVAARRLALTGVLWAASASAAAVYSFGNVPQLDREYFRYFWADGFMPMPPRNLRELAWLPGKLVWVFGLFAQGLGRTNGGLNYPWSPVFAVVMGYGYWTLWRRKRDAALFLLVPVVVTISMSAAGLYPFTARLIVFLIPFLLIVIAAGAHHLLTNWPERIQSLSPVALAVLGGAPIYAAAMALPPSWLQHTRPIFEHISQQRAPGDRIYIYFGAGPAFGYYAPRVGIPLEGVTVGGCHISDPRRYLFELDQMRGARRAWFVATARRAEEIDAITGYLDRIGRRVEVLQIGSKDKPLEDARAYLYDLSDPARLAATSAETHSPVPEGRVGPQSVWGCYGTLSSPLSRPWPSATSRLRSAE